MKKNMGMADRTIRIGIAVILALLYLFNKISGTAAIISLVIAGIFILTSFISFCPLYLPFRISTREKQKKE
ncbi:MAG: DUF2892 domain-containing protein [Bacteroidetes bacterium]|nr:DUF2892 domain-containing protein [Bacteroidota bacterium]